jgi:Sap, sulfolipid-1-addressing protein
MNATFFGLAFLAALNPKLLGVDLLLMNMRRQILMFVCFLLGGMGVALAVGLLDVLVLQANAINTQVSVSAGLDVALGVPLLVIGALVATGRLHGRRRAPAQAGHGQAPKKDPKKDEWAQRLLRKPRYGLIVLIGIGCGLPGGIYLAALHTLVTGKSSTATQVVAVIVFVLIEFALVIIPLVFLVISPEGAQAQTKRAQDWLMSHARQLIAGVILFVGAYMVINGLARLIG